MNILVIENATGGHNLHLYLSAILKKFSKSETVFLLTSNELFRNKNFKRLNKILKIKVFNKKFPKKPSRYSYISSMIYQFKYYFFIKKNFKELKKNLIIDHVYINNLNHFDKAISLLGTPFKDVSFSCFYTNLNIFLGIERYSKKKFFNFIYYYLFLNFYNIRTLKQIFISNPLLKIFLNKKRLISKIRYVEEFSKLENYKNREKKFKNRNIRILVYGAIRFEKDIENLFKLQKYDFVKENVTIIIAGKQQLNINKFIREYSRKYENIVVFNYFINPRFENYLFNNSDFVWIGYKKNFFGSSGVFFQAAIAHKKIICSNHGLVAWFNKIYKIGLSTNLEDTFKIVNYLKIDNKIKTSNYTKINFKHNENNFVNKIYGSIVSNFEKNKF